MIKNIIGKKKAFQKGLLALSFLLFACEYPVEIARTSVDVVVAKAGKANFLVLSNLGSRTSGKISVRSGDTSYVVSPSQMSSLMLREEDEPSIRHAHLPAVPLPMTPDGADTDFAPGLLSFAAASAATSYNINGTLEFHVITGPDKKEGKKLFTLYKKVSDTVEQDTYTIYYWADPKVYEKENTLRDDNKIGSADIKKIADKFSDINSGKDILGATIKIFGVPWGPNNYPNLIPARTRDIHILLYDIQSDAYGQGSRILGYFYNRDNIANAPNSNRKLIMAIDSPYLSRVPDSVYSTMIHEFQHMIHYYQKTIFKEIGELTETWLNEMLSQAAVDLVSPKIGLGNKSLYKRIGRYLRKPWNSPTEWNSSVTDYDTVSALGAYLLRHYADNNNSAALARQILQNSYTGTQAITSITGVSWQEMLRNWGVRTLKSYEQTSDLQAIDPWQILEAEHKQHKVGIPMFHLMNKNFYQYMMYFHKNGNNTYYYRSEQNSIKFPRPGGHVFVSLGKPRRDTQVDLKLPKGIVHELISY